MAKINSNNQILVLNQETEDANQEYEVEKIIDMRITPKLNEFTQKLDFIKEYLIKWVGYEQPTWEPLENLDNCKELLKEFYKEKKRLLKEKAKKGKNPKINKKDQMHKKDESVKKSKQKKSNNKNKSNSSLLNNKNKEKIKQKLFLTQKIIGNINNYIINQNNLIVNEEKQEDKNIINDKENINNNPILNECQQNNESKNYQELKEENCSQNKYEENNEFKIINGEICDENYEIINMDYKSIERMYEIEKYNLLNNNNNIIFEQFPNNMGYDSEDKMDFDSKHYGIMDEREELLKKRKNEIIEDSSDKNNKIIIKEINNVKIPKKIKDNFSINVTYLDKNDNKIYNKDFESNSKMIPKEFLIKYYENILYEKNKGHTFSKKLSFS